MTIDYKKGAIYYEEHGSGPTLVLLHGFLESSNIWNEYKEHLSRSFRLILIDLPGHGNSLTDEDVYSMDFMAGSVKAVLDHLKIDSAVVIGHSMGGYVSLAFARKYSRMLKGLGLFHSTSLADSDEVRQLREKSIATIQRNPEKYISTFIPQLFASETKDLYLPEIKQLVTEASRMNPKAIMASQEGMKERSSTLDVLINASFPVMFIAGQKDSRVPFENIWVQMALTETAYSLILRNVGHMGYIEARIQCLDFIESFTRACNKLV
jgi:pimeloyl-ACP methyl ester carboxylesterase